MSWIFQRWFQCMMVQTAVILCCWIGKRSSKIPASKTVVPMNTVHRKMKTHLIISQLIKGISTRLIHKYHISKRYTHSKKDHIAFQCLDYLYFFRSHNLCVYFFKIKGVEKHSVYFEGVDEIGDVQYLSFPTQLFDGYTLQSIHQNLAEEGFLFEVTPTHIIRHNQKPYTVFGAFHHLHESFYHQEGKGASFDVEGYSLGGCLSQIFVYVLLQKKYIQKNHIQMDLYVIESWWAGSEEFYHYLNSYVQVHNVMCIGSILYYYNIWMQRFFKMNQWITSETTTLNSHWKYLKLPFPMGITEYFGDHHYISRFLRRDGKTREEPS